MKTGTVVHTFSCGEVITGLKFSPNYKFLLTSTNTGWIYIWSVPSNIEREIMFKSNQKSLRITETPKYNANIDKSESFTVLTEKNSAEKEERKAWEHTKEKKIQEPANRGSMPDWARSTVNFNDFGENEDDDSDNSTMKNKKNDPFEKLQMTVTDDEDEEEKHIDGLLSVMDDSFN